MRRALRRRRPLVSQLALRSRRRRRRRPSAGSPRSAAATSRELRAELLLLRAWGEVTTARRRGRRRHAARGRRARRRRRRPLRARAARDGARLRRDRRRATSSEAERAARRGRRAPASSPAARHGLRRLGRTPPASPRPRAASTRRSSYADAATAVVPGLPRSSSRSRSVRAYILIRLGRHDEAARAADRLREIAARLGSPGCSPPADHDDGLLALLARRPRARRATCSARALDADAPRPGRRGAPAPRRGARAAAAAPTRPTRRSAPPRSSPSARAHRPAVLVARMTFVQALVARARGDDALAERRLARGRAPLGCGSAPDRRGRLPRLARRPRPPAGRPRRRRARAAELATRSREEAHARRSTTHATTAAPSRRCGSCCTTRRGSPSGGPAWPRSPTLARDGDFTLYPDGLSGLPDAAHAAQPTAAA